MQASDLMFDALGALTASLGKTAGKPGNPNGRYRLYKMLERAGSCRGAAEQGGVVTRLDEEKALMSRCRDHSSWRSVERLAVTPPDAPRRIERKSPCNPPCDKGDGDVSPAAINTVREPVRLCSAAEKGTPKEPEGVAAATFLLGAPPRGALT
jgi:hypothetical protein